MTSEFRAPAWRVWVLAAAFLTCACVVLSRLYLFQVLDHERLRGLAEDEQAQDIEIHPKRGALIDGGRRVPVLVKGRLAAEDSARVTALKLPGLYLQPAPYRVYPEGSIAAQVLGFVGLDAHGLAG